jgi:hypothetical protein
MSLPFHLPFLGVIHYVTLWHLPFPFPIRPILFPKGSSYHPWVFSDVGVSSLVLWVWEASSPGKLCERWWSLLVVDRLQLEIAFLLSTASELVDYVCNIRQKINIFITISLYSSKELSLDISAWIKSKCCCLQHLVIWSMNWTTNLAPTSTRYSKRIKNYYIYKGCLH